MMETITLFKGENLLLQFDKSDEVRRLFLGSREPNSQWYYLNLETAKAIRDSLDKGISLMEKEDG